MLIETGLAFVAENSDSGNLEELSAACTGMGIRGQIECAGERKAINDALLQGMNQCGSTHHLTSGLTHLGKTPIRTVRLLDNTTSSSGANYCRTVGPFT